MGRVATRKRSRTGQTPCATTPVLLRGQNPERRGLVISNLGNATVFIGTDSSVTTATGFGLTAGGYFTIDTGDDIYIVSAIGGEMVSYYEVTR